MPEDLLSGRVRNYLLKTGISVFFCILSELIGFANQALWHLIGQLKSLIVENTLIFSISAATAGDFRIKFGRARKT
jgi:hypothetical protein